MRPVVLVPLRCTFIIFLSAPIFSDCRRAEKSGLVSSRIHPPIGVYIPASAMGHPTGSPAHAPGDQHPQKGPTQYPANRNQRHQGSGQGAGLRTGQRPR